MWRKIIPLLWFAFFSTAVFATHNKAGDITFKHISGLTYEITVTIFADGNSPAIARKEIQINWGDNSGRDSIKLSSETPIDPSSSANLKRIWIKNHTFPGPGSYRIRIEDPNRNAGVDNINNSVNVPFTLETLLRISPFAGEENNSVVLRNDPVDNACAGIEYRYNPGAFDVDGDSIAYKLAESKGIDGGIAPGFQFPPSSNSLTVDAISGDLIWDVPNQIGLYNVAIVVEEYRNKVKISEVLRDLQIRVIPGCNNQPPTIFANNLFCVEAENTINIPIAGSDQNIQDKVDISATGEVLEPPINSRTNFNVGVIGNPTNASFNWNTNCSDVRADLYNLSIKAEDNADERGSVPLVNFKNIGIKVVAPSPKNFSLNPVGNSIQLNWDNSDCQNSIGYFLYRKIDSSGFSPDSCTIGVPEEIGYSKIATLNGFENTQFLDDDKGNGLVPGQKYCYLVTSFFKDQFESIASVEICGEVEKVVPLITNVSVSNTDSINGSIELAWSPPDPFDQIAFPPPYRYLVFQISNGQNELLDSTNYPDDTTFTVNGLNTIDQDYNYKVQLLSLGDGRKLVGQSPPASSIFLTTEASDELINLSWTVNVPWNNQLYTIYRQSPDSINFDSIGTTQSLKYTDSALTNGEEYCYFIESEGAYNLTSVKQPLLNKSQIKCDVPVDNVSPCPPELEVTADCINSRTKLEWDDLSESCAPDLAFYSLFRSSTRNGDLELLKQFDSQSDTIFEINDENINAGCFAISATDSTGNESEFSELICVEYCPIYELPNVFTPNGDAINDLYTPIKPYRDVDSIDISIFNRWGEKVYETKNPSILWTGFHKDSDKLVSDGVYFYNCLVFEKSLETDQPPRVLKGTISIFDGDSSNKTN